MKKHSQKGSFGPGPVLWAFPLLLLFPLFSAAEEGRLVRLAVYYAYENPCELCRDEADFIEFFNRVTADVPGRPEIAYNGFNVFRLGTARQFASYASQLGIDTSRLPFPILIIGDEYLAGEEAIREGLRELFIRQAESSHNEIAVSASVNAGAGTAAGTGTASRAPLPEYPPVSPQESVLVSFVTTACENCEKAKTYLERLPESVSLGPDTLSPVRVISYNVAEDEGLAAARQFFEAYRVPDNEQIVPIVFYTSGYLSGYSNIQSDTPAVLAAGKALNFAFPDEGGEIRSLSRLELPAIFLAGLLGGINPCSISMLLLLLSLLAAKNAHVLPLGLSYVASKLLTYLILGLLLFTLARSLDSALFRAAQGLVRVVVIVLSLSLCLLNMLDFINARRENYGAIRVQLPRALRRFNHSIIQKTVEGDPRYLMAAIFVLGVLVSAGEFLCTGQIYLATILYLLRTDTGSFALAFLAFLCYTIAAALPPALLVILCHKGKQAMALSDFVRNRMPLIKIANTLFFALFAAFAFFYF
ncbi:MAG: hypothetical protein LBK83_06320 [Treponema sp.]|jgi:hypothetical protein|nr:hypothetical protein [Treponema sp.]